MRNWFEMDRQTEHEAQRGHLLIITARWVLVVVGMVLTLINPADVFELQVGIVVLLTLAVANFFLHVNVLAKRYVPQTLLYAATLGDLAVISTIVGTASENAFVFYFVAVLAYGLVFPWRMALLFTGGVVVAYTGISLIPVPDDFSGTAFFARVLMLAAVVSLATIYRNVEWRRLKDESIAHGIGWPEPEEEEEEKPQPAAVPARRPRGETIRSASRPQAGKSSHHSAVLEG